MEGLNIIAVGYDWVQLRGGRYLPWFKVYEGRWSDWCRYGRNNMENGNAQYA